MRRICLALLAVAAAALTGSAQAPLAIATHDNLKPAGRLQNGELQLSLWVGEGRWHPEGPKGSVREVEAFGEANGPLSIPSPLIRVPQGTTVRAAIRNALSHTLRIHGLCDRPGPCDPIDLPAGASRDVRFTLKTPGTFHYSGSTVAPALDLRDGQDSQLGGAIVVDPPGAEARDRVFVMGLMTEGTRGSATDLTVINGRTWPHTERLRYSTGETVRWRIINLSASAHAMHLHGFYFRVDSVGDGVRDTRFAEEARRLAVTEQMPPGRAIAVTWIPERAGNWLFHCHMLVHMTPPDEHPGGAAGRHATDDASAGMAGLVLGVHISGPNVDRASPAADSVRRALRLVVDPDTRLGSTPSYKVSLTAAGQPASRINDRAVPGPVMLLTRGEPVAVEVVNRLKEPTSIHWHGIELESYDDGVAGFGGIAGSVTPPVAPGGTFTARFTPTHAGTFIYHTHWHNAAQLAAGIYGPIVVIEPGQTFDPETDHLIVIGLDGPNRPLPDEPFAVNGEAKPRPLDLTPGVAHRLRFINITADNVALTLQLVSRFDPIQWTLIGKDGSDVPPAQRSARPARQLVTVGETYDFELAPMPPTPVGLWMELRRGNGELLLQWPVRVGR